MHRLIAQVVFFVLLACCFITPAAAKSQADTVSLKLEDSRVQVDGVVHELEVAPYAIEGVTMVPLRFLVEVFGAKVSWEPETKEIIVKHNDQVICLQPDTVEATVNGNACNIVGKPTIEKGVAFVPLRFLVENLNYQVSFSSQTKEIHIKQLPPPNQPPVAEFSLKHDTVAQGETVVYEEKSYDPDGDQIVETKWTGNERAYFAPGEYTVSLEVKDIQGAWSEPCTRNITVTEEIKMDRLTYNLHNPVPGEPLGNLEDMAVLDMQLIDPAVTMNKEIIMVSNSPETIPGDGILYSDVLSGQNRLYYHHLNGTEETKKIYLMAINQGSEPVQVILKKWGVAGPADPMAVGRAAAYRYFDFDISNVLQLKVQPGEKIILNEDISNIVKPDNTIHGLFDIKASDELLFSVVAVGDQNPVTDYDTLAILPRDGKHIRGTFPMANRTMSVQVGGEEPERLIIADGEDDAFLYGEDKNTSKMGHHNLRSHNSGNYGVIYSIKIKAQNRVGVLFSPRGGVFAGAGEWSEEAFYLPNKGILKPQTEYAMIGVVEPGKEKVLKFIPPAGSYLPINLIFVPF